MIKQLYKYRFDLFLSTQVLILFGSLIFPHEFHEERMLPILFMLNILAGILLLMKKKKLMWFSIILFAVSAIIFGRNIVSTEGGEDVFIRLSIYFIFHLIVTWNIIQQVWNAKQVNRRVIMGLMSGYISLGLLGFFLFMSIELWQTGSFSGPLLMATDFKVQADGIMYYAYITLLTIGYGEIVPVTPVAQKAAILVGLIGQFYMVIITAVVIEKYIRARHK